VTDKYSDHLPSFKDSEEEEGEVRGYRRFTDWVDDGYSKAGRKESRPFVRMAALLVMIFFLGYGSSRPQALKKAIVGEDHPRIALPIRVSVEPPAEWTEANVRAAISTVQPKAAACLKGWSDLSTNDEGAVVAEVVLNPTGPEEAALYDQSVAVPQGVGDCLAESLGSVSWPLPETQQSVIFPIVGGT
jgi:hypothetical protein